MDRNFFISRASHTLTSKLKTKRNTESLNFHRAVDSVTRERKSNNTNKIRYVKIKRQPIPILASLAQTEN